MPDHEPHQFSRIAEELIGDLRGVPTVEPRRQRKRPTRPAGDVIQALVRKYHLGESSPEQALRDAWPDLVTPILANYSHVVEISSTGRLVVLVSNSVAKQELTNNRQIFLKRIKAVPGCEQVRGLSLRAG